jgi:4-hydroxy-4-methyl-2-oxoglutarate aldolase
MNPPHSPEELEALRQLDACALANAIETFHVRLRNEGFGAGAIRCLFPRLRPMVGYAATLKIHGASPPKAGASTYLERTDWWDYVLSVPAPRVVVVQDASSDRGRGAFLGGVHVNILRALGCIGAVTDGAVRDLPAVEDLGFHFFASGLSVSHSYVHIVETGQPVQFDGLTIQSGDLLHGDLHGFQTVPHELAPALPAVAAALTARERSLIALARSPHVSIEKLRAAVAGDRST